MKSVTKLQRYGYLLSAMLMMAMLVHLPLSGLPASDDDDQARLKAAEAKRIAAIGKVSPSVAAVFGPGGGGGGSGVVITPDGYCLTNFHVTEPCGRFMYCGLADGNLYEAVLVGQDPVGDVALIKLIPKIDKKPFPFAVLGDSDLVRPGDWSLAMGNPFLLATDFTPTITFGIISGTHRYQEPAGVFLEYADCIQTEASINPGNSGGPLFNLDGEVIGINGRGSFEKRGRVNSGVGYAISINQIKHFMGHLRGGLNCDHATLGATVKSDDEGRLKVNRVLDSADVARRGLKEGDEILSFANRSLTSVNQFKNVLGIFPKGWRLPLEYRSFENEKDTAGIRKQSLVRLQGVIAQQVKGNKKQPNEPRPGPGGPPAPVPEKHAGKQLFKTHSNKDLKTRFANYYFNEKEWQRIWLQFAGQGSFQGKLVALSAMAQSESPVKNPMSFKLDEKVSEIKLGDQTTVVEPLKSGETPENLAAPAGSGGLGMALFHWRRLLTIGPSGFEPIFYFGGKEPWYPSNQITAKQMCKVLVSEYAATTCKWYFSEEGQLMGCDCYLVPDSDPCEISFGDFKPINGVTLPHQFSVRYSDKEFSLIKVQSWSIGK